MENSEQNCMTIVGSQKSIFGQNSVNFLFWYDRGITGILKFVYLYIIKNNE